MFSRPPSTVTAAVRIAEATARADHEPIVFHTYNIHEHLCSRLWRVPMEIRRAGILIRSGDDPSADSGGDDTDPPDAGCRETAGTRRGDLRSKPDRTVHVPVTRGCVRDRPSRGDRSRNPLESATVVRDRTNTYVGLWHSSTHGERSGHTRTVAVPELRVRSTGRGRRVAADRGPETGPDDPVSELREHGRHYQSVTATTMVAATARAGERYLVVRADRLLSVSTLSSL